MIKIWLQQTEYYLFGFLGKLYCHELLRPQYCIDHFSELIPNKIPVNYYRH